MGLVNVDTSSESIFTQDSFEPIPPGVYICSIGNIVGTSTLAPEKLLRVQTSKSSNKPMVPVQLRIEAGGAGEETPFKGRIVYDNCALSADFGIKRLVQMALAFDAMTKDEIKALGGVDLERFTPDQRARVEIKISMRKPYDNPEGEPEPENRVKRYMFEE